VRQPERKWWRRQFDTVEVLLICLLVIGATAAVARRKSVLQDDWLRQQYGPSKWSYNAEEWIVRDFFEDRRDGVFVDIGSADARKSSNTYYLESKLGWSGVAVDALAEHAPSYAQYRPRTQFFALFVGDRSDARATLYVSERAANSSMSRQFTEFYNPGKPIEVREVPTITMNDLLDRAGVSRVDFLTMDIEMAEPVALAGFDIGRFKPALVCVEAHPPIRQWLIDYFVRHDYRVVAKYLWADWENLYFAPLPPD
jgi:FkbM family methyltransferase